MKTALCYIFLVITVNLNAQDTQISNPKAVKSIDGIVNEVLNIVSAESGEQRDWETFHSLFLPNARLTVLYHNTSMPVPVKSFTVEEFIEIIDQGSSDHGFQETEIYKVVDEYNGIAQVFQSYYAEDTNSFKEKGINSCQLVYYHDRWWIVNLIWTDDSNGVEIPEQYLK